MSQDEIIEMAVKAGIAQVVAEVNIDIMEAFAKLVEKRKVNQIADACAKLPFGATADSFAVWIREQ